MEKAKKPYKNSFQGSHPKMWKIKKGFLPKIAWHYLCQEGRKTHFRAQSVLAKIFLDQNSVKQETL